MADYKDIFSTRKLNNDKKANLAKYGINGDTEVGIVNNQPSHINAWEASLISSFGKAGEEYVKDIGAGTKNPYTGMPQFHEKAEGVEHDPDIDDHIYHGTTQIGKNPDYDENTDDPSEEFLYETDWNTELYSYSDYAKDPNLRQRWYKSVNPYEGQIDYATAAGMSEADKAMYIVEEFGLKEHQTKYLTPFTTRPQEFMKKQAETATQELSFATGMETSAAIGDIRTESQKGAAQAGFAKGIVDPLDAQMKAITSAARTHSLAQQKAQTELEAKIYGEEQRQIEGLYEDIGALEGVSDRRLKEDIKYIADSSSGLKIYQFKYIGREGTYQGVMSDEIPEYAVIKHPSGYDRVNYSLIDVDFKRIDNIKEI